ncbi:MAG: family 43 glycosylhydrolase [Lachnospiraceae bacterium]|nr:family 43 glycosylhydrolase [Lachnospiraceae bacterium]
MNYVCNPLNIDYRYQFNVDQRNGGILQICREAADPSMIMFKGKYYIFASMNLKVWVSEDMVKWDSYFLPDNLPLYDYAPDVRVIGDYVYFSASKKGEICDFYRTKDVINGPYEKIPGTFEFWDPNIFADDDGRIYFYWGCDSMKPIYGVELDPETLHQIGEPKELIFGDPHKKGFERVGENNSTLPASDEEVEAAFRHFLSSQGADPENPPAQLKAYESAIKGMFANRPFIEGAWMTKHNGKYYLQYACPGTQYNTYADGYYESDSPLGPFTLGANAPYSFSPGGYMPGAGHGSTMEDKHGNLWHTATMRISKNHDFERRVGIWPAGFDADGELVCNQRYATWPMEITGGKQDIWANPKWYLLNYGKEATASSVAGENVATNVCDENCQTWWKADTKEAGQWVMVDLGEAMDVRAVQINFGDDKLDLTEAPGEIRPGTQARFIDDTVYKTRWTLEASTDGENFTVVEDKSQVDTDLPHDLVVREDGISARYIKLTVQEVPYNQPATISGIRVFGKGNGEAPEAAKFTAVRQDNKIDMDVKMEAQGAVGYNILWGESPEKLYHSWMTYENSQKVSALVADREYYVRVDSFNENGITEGEVIKLQ